jgi:hypothetical protein
LPIDGEWRRNRKSCHAVVHGGHEGVGVAMWMCCSKAAFSSSISAMATPLLDEVASASAQSITAFHAPRYHSIVMSDRGRWIAWKDETKGQLWRQS